MTKTIGWRAVIIACLVLLASAGSERSLAAEKASGCWGCAQGGEYGFLVCGVMTPGYWNCWQTSSGCGYASWGCGSHALVPTDADGSAQVTTLATNPAELGENLPSSLDHRPCDGVIVARRMSSREVLEIQASTAVLTL